MQLEYPFLSISFFQFTEPLVSLWQPIWAETDQSTDYSDGQINRGQCSYTRVPSLYPQRVPPQLFRKASTESIDDRRSSIIYDAGQAFSSAENSDESSSDLEPDMVITILPLTIK